MKTALLERASNTQDRSVRHVDQSVKEVDNPVSSGRQIVNQAREVSHGQCHAAIHHCNTFLDSVLRPLGFDLPWSQTSIPALPKIRQAIEFDERNWERAWPKDNLPLNEFKEQPGDLCFWDKAIVTNDSATGHSQMKITHLEHAGILDGKGEVLSAQAQDDAAVFDGNWRMMCHSPSFGTPTAILRYRKIERQS
jgi:hypothetical protein